jgi:hypothetical protein
MSVQYISGPPTCCPFVAQNLLKGYKSPVGIDVGHCRLNLTLLHGVEIADQFLKSYIRVSDTTFVYDPYWGLKAVFEFLHRHNLYF